MFSSSPRFFVKNSPNSFSASRRFLSAQQAAVALRPFYFAVHPDRFARNPQIREKNEKSLQIFNGYLNELFPNRYDNQKQPIEVNFSIDAGNGKMRDVSMSLSATDPQQIVRMALEKCELSTSHVPEPKSAPSPGISSPTTFSPAADVDDLFRRMYSESSARRKKGRTPFVKSRDLFAGLVRNREQALKNAESFEHTRETLREEVEYLSQKTGLKEIVWTMDWAQSHMRRCLSALNRLLDHASPENRETMIHALHKYTLRFGRGSFVCCDGGLQFGADQVPEAWEQVCLEANVRRFQLRTLNESRKHLSHLFGGAEIVVSDAANLLQTVDQFRSVIIRITSRSKDDAKKIRALGAQTVVEIATAYDELSLGRDGRLVVPCNVDVVALTAFLEELSDRAREKNKNAHQDQIDVENLRTQCCKKLNLKGISWEPGLARDALMDCLQRLQSAKEEIRSSLSGLQIRIAANPNVYVTAEGHLSVPVDWI